MTGVVVRRGCVRRDSVLAIAASAVAAASRRARRPPGKRRQESRGPATPAASPDNRTAGKAPARHVSTKSDPRCAAEGGAPMTNSIVVGANGALQNVFVYVKTGSAISYSRYPPPRLFSTRRVASIARTCLVFRSARIWRS